MSVGNVWGGIWICLRKLHMRSTQKKAKENVVGYFLLKK